MFSIKIIVTVPFLLYNRQIYNTKISNRKGDISLSNYILEEKIKTLSTQYIEQQSVSSFLLLLMGVLEREYQKDETFHYKIPDDVLDLQYAVKNYVLQLEDLLDDDNKDACSAALEDCIDLKKKLISIYETIYQYSSLWSLYCNNIMDEVAIRKYKEENISNKKIEWDIFYSDCEQFLEEADNVLEQKKRIGQLLKTIPFQMARSKYYDIIKQNLHQCFQEESEALIAHTLNTFYNIIVPENNKDYGKYFTELAQWFSSHNNIIARELSDEELHEGYTDFDSVFNDLQKIDDIFSCLFNDINALIALFFLGYNFLELTEQDASHADLYHTVCEMLSGELSQTEIEAYLDQLPTTLENAVEVVIDKANDIGQKELKYMKKIQDFAELSDDTKKILLTEDFLRSCYYGELNEEIFQADINEDLPPASAEWKQKAFDEFIDAIAKAFSKMPTSIRKTSMQILLGVLPSIFSVEETLSMIKTAVESASILEQKILILDKIGMVFEENGFYCEEEENNEDFKNFSLSDFNFDDHCDCGHDHHHHDHHDHCDCGHDHHHHHHHDHE